MIVAIVSTKIPMWLGHDFLFHLPKLDRYGFWNMLHSRDALIARRLAERSP